MRLDGRMRRVVPAILALLLTGCLFQSTEDPPAPPTEALPRLPLDLAAHRNETLLLDVNTGSVEVVVEAYVPAWLSDSGRYVLHGGRAGQADWLLLDRLTGEREPVPGPQGAWARLLDDASVLTLDTAKGRARVVDARTGEERSNATLPPPPGGPDEGRWTHASDDLSVLGAELFSGVCCMPCSQRLHLQGPGEARHETSGCGLAMSALGRAAWSERHAVHLREADGALVRVSPGGGYGAPVGSAYLDHGGPALLGETGVAYVRVVGTVSGHTTDSGPQVDVTRTDVVVHDLPAPEGRVVASLAGAAGVRAWGGSAEGRFLLLSVS